MTYSKGDFVHAKIDMRRSPVGQARGTIDVKAGDELVITSVGNYGWLNVKRTSGGVLYVFSVEESQVRPLARSLGEVPEGGFDPYSESIQWLWEDAARLAERLDFCRDYDQLCDTLGIPGRMRVWPIKIQVDEGLQITAKVTARSERLARQDLATRMAGANSDVLKQITS